MTAELALSCDVEAFELTAEWLQLAVEPVVVTEVVVVVDEAVEEAVVASLSAPEAELAFVACDSWCLPSRFCFAFRL